jgi:phenylpropionate dioxygenase-like ring-hydroxylating dioxygenase large terminal subunit
LDIIRCNEYFDKLVMLCRLPDDFDKPEFSSVTIQRDLFYGYDTLMENVSDPSHIDFAHHKVYTFNLIKYWSFVAHISG